MNRTLRRTIWVLGITAVAMLCLVPEAQAWWDSNWSRRCPVTITYSGSALSDYQVRVSVTYDSDMQADFDDIRFIDSNDSSALDHWRETYSASSSAVFWVEVPSIPDGGKTIYMYYGNGGASSASNGDDTFLYFCDFETSAEYDAWDKWASGGSCSYSRSTSQNHTVGGSYSLEFYDPENAYYVRAYSPALGTSQTKLKFMYWVYIVSEGTGAAEEIFGQIYFDDGKNLRIGSTRIDKNDDGNVYYYDGSTEDDTGYDCSHNTWFKITAKTDVDTDNAKIQYNDSGSYSEDGNWTSATTMGAMYAVTGTEPTYTVYLDDVAFAKYVGSATTEPSTSVGSEELAILRGAVMVVSKLYLDHLEAVVSEKVEKIRALWSLEDLSPALGNSRAGSR